MAGTVKVVKAPAMKVGASIPKAPKLPQLAANLNPFMATTKVSKVTKQGRQPTK